MSSKINANLKEKKYTNKWLGIVFMVLFAGASPQSINYCLFVTQTMSRHEACTPAKVQTFCGCFLS